MWRTGFKIVWFLWCALFTVSHLVQHEPEFFVTLLLIGVCYALPRAASALMDKPRRLLNQLARRPLLAAACVGIAVLVIRIALLPLAPVPIPLIHDEAAYLLAADTFASGRVANPSHPLWIHMESIHVNHTPTYIAKYPPAQGVVMGLGQLLGHPWIGVCLSTGLMCSLLVWMLQGWLPARWALYGGALASAQLGIWSYWMNSYWGGSVAAIGGLLVLGSWPRLRKSLRPGLAVSMGLGLVILANSRPYEGAVVSSVVCSWVAHWYWREHRKQTWRWATRFALPVAAMLGAGVAAMLAYNVAATGELTLSPYVLHRQTYSLGPLFVWRPITQHPEYHHAIHEGIYRDHAMLLLSRWESLSSYLFNRTLQHLEVWTFVMGPLFAIPWLLVPWLVSDRRIRLPVVVLTVAMVAVSVTVSFQAHYWAPFIGLIWLVITQSIRHLNAVGRRVASFGRSYTALLPLALATVIVLFGFERAFPTPIQPGRYPVKTRYKRSESLHPMYQRELAARRLAEAGGQHLVIVRYADDHDVHADWVFNRADIDGSDVVWAYDMGQEKNQELLDYFSSRTVWLAEPDVEPYRLSPYREAVR